MFQNRALGREETLLRHETDRSPNLLDHPGEWYVLAPQYSDEHWRITSFNLVIAGPGLLTQLRGFGGAGGDLEFGLDLYDGLGSTRNMAPVVFHASESAKDWKAGHHNGTVMDLAAGVYDNGNPRAGLRGDLRQPRASSVWTSEEFPLRYGKELTGLSWQADLLRDASGIPLNSARLILETAVAGAGGSFIWTASITISTGAELSAGRRDFAPIRCERYRFKIELDFFDVGEMAHRELFVRQTSTFFLVGVWISLESPWWTIRSLADLIHRAEADRELRTGGYDGNWDICVARLPVSAEIIGRRAEGVRARINQPGNGLRLLEVHAVTDVWYEDV